MLLHRERMERPPHEATICASAHVRRQSLPRNQRGLVYLQHLRREVSTLAKDDTPPRGTERVNHSACGGKGYISDFGNRLPCSGCGGTGKVLVVK